MKRIVTVILAIVLVLTLVGCGSEPGSSEELPQYATPKSSGIVYKRVGLTSLSLELLYPTKRVSEKNPTVLVFHGGGWISGEPADFLTEFDVLCDELRENGVTVAAVEYRKALDGLTWRDCLDDCEDALSYLVENASRYDIDVERIGVAGYSAGAHLAMMVAIETGNQVRGCLSFSGPTCFSDNSASAYYSEPLAYYMTRAFDAENLLDIYRASPLVRLSRKCGSEFLLVSGSGDTVIPPEHAYAFEREGESFGLSVEARIIRGLSHSYASYPELTRLLEESAEWLCERIDAR